MDRRILLIAGFLLCFTVLALSAPAGDPAIESVVRKAYDFVLKGDMNGFTSCCHPEIGQYRGTFDTGYNPGRSGGLGELMMLAMGVREGETFKIAHLKVEVVRVDGDRAIARAKYRAVTRRPSSLEMTKGQVINDEWDAQDYLILKKHKGSWRLRRLEDRAGHFFPLDMQPKSEDPFGGVN